MTSHNSRRRRSRLPDQVVAHADGSFSPLPPSLKRCTECGEMCLVGWVHCYPCGALLPRNKR